MALILVADDDPLLARLVEHKLRRAGFDVVLANDGMKALSMAAELRPALLVLDAMMPGFDGFEVLRRLRNDAHTASIPVLMLTARREEKDIVGALTRGAQDYMIKPFMPEELVARVRLIVGRHKDSA